MADKDTIEEARREINRLTRLSTQKSTEKGTESLLSSLGEINKNFTKKLDVLSGNLEETIRVLKDRALEANIDKKEIIEVIKNIKLDPNIQVEAPKIPEIKVPEIKIPEIKLPEIKVPKIEIPKIIVPQPRVEISQPEIKIPPVKFPKALEVTGFSSFIKALFVVLKKRLDINLGIDRDNPLPVILTDEKGRFYKALMAIGRIGGMGGMGGGGLLVDIIQNTSPATSPVIYNVAMTSANTEYSQLLPTAKRVDIKLRALGANLKIAYTVNNSGSLYITIPVGATYSIDKILLKDLTIYFQSPSASQTCEILVYT